jgi:hypothetical protein
MCVCRCVLPQLLGIEALITRDVRNTHKLLHEHLQKIRSMEFMQHTLAVLSFESNLAFESQHLLHHLNSVGFKKWMSLSEGAHSGHGWLTTHERKEVRRCSCARTAHAHARGSEVECLCVGRPWRCSCARRCASAALSTLKISSRCRWAPTRLRSGSETNCATFR